MDYSMDQFRNLVDAVQREGGELTDVVCAARRFHYAKGKSMLLPGCGNTTILEIPYEGEDGQAATVNLCAVCDDLGQTPRYEHVMEVE